MVVTEPALLFPVERAFEEQEDLEQLCHDRALRTTEIFEPNAYYGIDQVVKRWAGVALDEPLHVAFPHGVPFKMLFYGRRERLPVLAYHWQPHRDALLRRGVTGRLWPFASPFLYASALLGPPSGRRAGTLAFVARLGEGGSEARARAAEIAALPDHLQPVAVCLRWQDVLAGAAAGFEALGLTVVSAGHANDPLFLLRLRQLCAAHEYVVTNGMGSHIFFAVASGATYVPALPGSPTEAPPTRPLAPWEDGPLLARGLAEVAALEQRTPSEQRAEVEHLLGIQHLEAPELLAARLRSATRLDRRTCWRPGVGPALPDALRRAGLRAVDAWRERAA
jgi:hypothetical protein